MSSNAICQLLNVDSETDRSPGPSNFDTGSDTDPDKRIGVNILLRKHDFVTHPESGQEVSVTGYSSDPS